MGGRMGCGSAPPTCSVLLVGCLIVHSFVAGTLASVDIADLAAWLEPPAEFGGFEHYPNAVLQPKGDRWDITSSAQHHGTPVQCLNGTALLVSDLCAMGHLAKDAAMVASWLLDHVSLRKLTGISNSDDRRIAPAHAPPLRYVIFANHCMTRTLSDKSGNKRSPLFHSVLQHWFAPSLSDILYKQRLAGGTQAAGNMSSLVMDSPITLPAEARWPAGFDGLSILFQSDLTEMRRHRPGGTLCFASVARRGAERWRWFRSREHAFWYRQRLWRYFGIGGTIDVAAKDNRRPCHLNVTVLERDEDRHFDESRAAGHLRERLAESPLRLPEWISGRDALKCHIAVQLVKFDKIKGRGSNPPPHPEQLRILAESTDVLVAAHGAGLASIVAMRPGTAVIELFPHNFRYVMYEELARLAGLQYFSFESRVVHPPRCCSARGAVITPFLRKPHEGNGVGARACKKCDILLPREDLEHMVVAGLQTVVEHRYF